MGISDHKHVNFSEDYELNYHLELVGKSCSKENRKYLREKTRPRAKKDLNVVFITHGQFKPYVKADANKGNLS